MKYTKSIQKCIKSIQKTINGVRIELMERLKFAVMNQSIANQIRRARQNRDLSQDNMADELGITKGAYSKIERGITAISVERLAEIAKVLKMDVDMFFKKSVLEEAEPKYGFATKAEMETLAKMIDTIAREVKQLKEMVQEVKKPTKRK